MSCGTCGASLRDGRVTCFFCGAATRSGMTEDDELRALEEVRETLSRAVGGEVVNIWRSAYVPQHWAPAAKAFGAAIQGVVDEGELSRAAFARADGIYNTTTLSHLANPALASSALVMRESLERARGVAFATQLRQKAGLEAEAKLHESNFKLIAVSFSALAVMAVAAAVAAAVIAMAKGSS
jgi:hypothetical protein